MDIHASLVNIVGQERVSNNHEELFFYSRDSGAQHPRTVDYVIMPQNIVGVNEKVDML